MRKSYVKPSILVDQDLAEGVYLASGHKSGLLTVADQGVWDRWDGGGRRTISANWSGITTMVHLTVTFNDTIDEVAPTSATGSVQVSATGKTVDVTFNAAEAGGLQFVVKINHGTSIYDLAVTNYDYTVS